MNRPRASARTPRRASGSPRRSCVADLGADLEVAGPDGRPEPGQERVRAAAEGPHRRLDHPRRQAAPAGVRGGHRIAPIGREQDRQAVRRQDRADPAGHAGDRPIRRRADDRGPRAKLQVEDSDAVRLREPHRLRRAVRRRSRKRRRFSATASGASPTWSPRFNEAKRPVLTPPRAQRESARTFGRRRPVGGKPLDRIKPSRSGSWPSCRGLPRRLAVHRHAAPRATP